jgi:hypothetical protein
MHHKRTEVLMSRWIRGGVAASVLLGLGAIGYAQDKPCMADAAKLCPGVEPGGGAQIECLKTHKQELSPACKKKVMQMKVKSMENKELQKQQAEPPPANGAQP